MADKEIDLKKDVEQNDVEAANLEMENLDEVSGGGFASQTIVEGGVG